MKLRSLAGSAGGLAAGVVFVQPENPTGDKIAGATFTLTGAV
jgi:hypothetical protein